MVYALDITDETNVLIITNELNALLEKKKILQEKIYYLLSLKHFVDATNERVFEHYFD